MEGDVDGGEHEQGVGRPSGPRRQAAIQASTSAYRRRGLRVAWVLRRSAVAVDVGAMVDPDDSHCGWVVLYLVHDSVGPPAGRPEAGELSLQGVADAAWCIDEGSEHELDDRSGHALG